MVIHFQRKRKVNTDMEQTTAQRQHRRKRNPPILLYMILAVLAILAIVGIASLVGIAGSELALKLNGEETVTVEFGAEYQEKGVTVLLDGEPVELDVSVTGNVAAEKLGTYTLTYSVKHYWKTAEITRTVQIVDTKAPTITLVYNENSFTLPGHEYVEEGFAAEDNYDGDLTANVERKVENDTVYYRVKDSSGNETVITRPIQYGDFTAPDLKLLGDASITISAGERFEDPGYTAVDNADGDVTANVTVEGKVNIYVPGTYTITYTVKDSFDNVSEVTRTVEVKGRAQTGTVEPNGRVIYLTFDDGPSKYTLDLLEVLEKYQVKATFFVVGDAAMGYLDEIAAGGHAIGIHSDTHDFKKIYTSEEAFFDDIETLRQKIYDRTGIDTTLLRFPGGSSNTVSKKHNKGIMTRLTKAVEAQGYQYFDWNVDSNDAGGAKTSEEVYNNVINGVKNRKNSIVLQHDIKKFSVEAVEDIIVWGLENGYTFLPLDPTSPTAHHGVNN